MKDFQSELSKLQGWEIVVVNSVARLRKTYRFKNFVSALAFTNQVGALAEEHNHHPEIITEWGQVTISWWTHTAKGLTPNDFDMAGRVDALTPN